MFKFIFWLRSFRLLPTLVVVAIVAAIITQQTVYALAAIALAVLSGKE